MNYQETINWMFNQLPMYQLQGASAYKKDLTNAYFHSHRLSDMHKYANGVPAVSFATMLDHCAVCAKAKLHKAAHGIASTRWATCCFQGLSIDFGFMVQ